MCCRTKQQRNSNQYYYSPQYLAHRGSSSVHRVTNASPPDAEAQSETDVSRDRAPFGMAAALILGLSLGAQKIQEKREKKKEKKALMQFAEEQREAKLRNDRTSRGKSEEARHGERRRSESLEREEAPPPSYADAVGESAYGKRK